MSPKTPPTPLAQGVVSQYITHNQGLAYEKLSSALLRTRAIGSCVWTRKETSTAYFPELFLQLYFCASADEVPERNCFAAVFLDTLLGFFSCRLHGQTCTPG